MATNMLPHNPGEACRAVTAFLDNPSVSVEELVRILPAPDFPTGGIIMGTSGIREAYVTGRGRCVVRGVAEITDEEKTPAILITEIDFAVGHQRRRPHLALHVVRPVRLAGRRVHEGKLAPEVVGEQRFVMRRLEEILVGRDSFL
jgi:DNA gyrase subunit A